MFSRLLLPTLLIACDTVEEKYDTGAEIINTAPSAPGVSISPSPAYTTDVLSVVLVDSDDAEGDPLTYRYVWSVGGVVIDLGETDSVPAEQTGRGQAWAVEVYASDGELESPAGEADIEIANTPPAIDGVTLDYDTPTTDGTLTCTAGATSDVDGDEVSTVLRWDVDGGVVAENKPGVLTGGAFSKGETVTCTVTPNDGAVEGAAASASLLIENTPPESAELSMNPERPIAGEDDLLCAVDADAPDADNDTITYTVTWAVDGLVYPDDLPGAAGPATTIWADDTVPAVDTLLGEEWTCAAVPSDGEADGPASSATATVRSTCDKLTVAFLPAWGLSSSGSLAWADVQANQSDYGDCTLTYVDVSAGFDYADLVKTGAEVLVSGDPGGGSTSYSTAELDAISDYLSKGHGGIVLTYAVSYNSYLNDDLVEWVGVDPTVMLATSASVSTTMSLLDTTHPLASGLKGKTVSPGGYSYSQEISTSWSKGLLTGADIVMENSAQDAVTIAYDDAWRGVWFTWMIEYSSTTTDGERMLYNSMVWSAGYNL